MRYSKCLIPTLKEKPKEAEAISHSLMLRSGLIRRFTSGVYSYLPLGWRILNKIVNIIREEMNKSGALEVLLPALHPLEIWEKSGRDKTLKDVLYAFKSQREKNFVLGPTHEEVITELVSKEVKSYKQLPLILYQIQTKFRDETRPRSGVLRSLEFIMKDAYSFGIDKESLEKSYDKMYKTYCNIFDKCGIPYEIVKADSGAMGGNVSHEFMVVSDNGEDRIAVCDKCGYSASLEVAECKFNNFDVQNKEGQNENLNDIKKVDTPGITSVSKVADFLNVSDKKLVKTIIYNADDKLVAVLIRADYAINELKLKNILKCEDLKLATDSQISKATGGPVGFSGPVNLDNIEVIADNSLLKMRNFVTGANEKDKHLINVNLDRDFNVDKYKDIRYIKMGDDCPECSSEIKIKNSIEIGHIFKLGTKYSKIFKANFADDNMQEHNMIMGCYGIGVSRMIAACIETNHDEDGIIWPLNISPFSVVILPLAGMDDSVNKVSERIYKSLLEKGIEVLIDDRDERAGVKFNDADLLGIPYRIIVGKRSVSENNIELQDRKNKKSRVISIEESVETVAKIVKDNKRI